MGLRPTPGARSRAVLNVFRDARRRVARVVNGERRLRARRQSTGDRARSCAACRRRRASAPSSRVPTQQARLSGWAEGTLSFDAARWSHARSGDILYSPDWTDNKNRTAWQARAPRTASPGTAARARLKFTTRLIAAGPDIKQGVTVSVPSGNVDFAPTFLRALGIAVPSTMQGRPLPRSFRGALAGPTPTVHPDSAHRANGRRLVFPDGALLDRARGRRRIPLSRLHDRHTHRALSRRAGLNALRYRPWICGRS